jgi:hypothetical protein
MNFNNGAGAHRPAARAFATSSSEAARGESQRELLRRGAVQVESRVPIAWRLR